MWHLTNFELVLSIKSIFIRLGPDWFLCCLEEKEVMGQFMVRWKKLKESLANSLGLRWFLTLHLCPFELKKSQNSINRNSNRIAFISLETQCWAGMVALKSLAAQTPPSPLFHYSLPLALSLMVQHGCYNSGHYHFVGKGVSFLSEILHQASMHSSLIRTLATWKDCRGDWEMRRLARCIMPNQKLIKIPVIKVLRYSANY